MPTWGWVLIGVGVAAAVGLVVLAVALRARTQRLRSTFGPEYDRTIAEAPSRREAEHVLSEREKRRAEFDLKPLTPAARERYAGMWRETQTRFVDDPGAAVAEADRLIELVMSERGYPVDDFEEQAADLSVDHPEVVENYREAHAVAVARTHGEAETEDLRRALVCYRSLFERLLETEEEPART
jgi:hypothetical protein